MQRNLPLSKGSRVILPISLPIVLDSTIAYMEIARLSIGTRLKCLSQADYLAVASLNKSSIVYIVRKPDLGFAR